MIKRTLLIITVALSLLYGKETLAQDSTRFRTRVESVKQKYGIQDDVHAELLVRGLEQKNEYFRRRFRENADRLRMRYMELKEQARQERMQTLRLARERGIPVSIGDAVLRRFEKGIPIYIHSFTSTPVRPLSTITSANIIEVSGLRNSYFVEGDDQHIGMWELRRPNINHREFEHWSSSTPRLTYDDSDNMAHSSASSGDISEENHATSVAGVMIAEGVSSSAQGMAPAAFVHAYSANGDIAELLGYYEGTEVRNNDTGNFFDIPYSLSNHSYGPVAGWWQDPDDNSWHWFGDPIRTESWLFGYYTYGDGYAELDDLDNLIAYEAPEFVVVAAAGNDRNQEGPLPGTSYTVYNANGAPSSSTAPRDEDCQSDNAYAHSHYRYGPGYNCVTGFAVAKNVIAVGSIDDNGTSLSDFSATGPTDDGRIKPDLVANGTTVRAPKAYNNSDNLDNNEYSEESGTSLSAPAVTGAIALLRQLAHPLILSAPAVKGLLIHTADDLGPNGPDYKFGWGRVNALEAGEVIYSNVLNWSAADNIAFNIIDNVELNNQQCNEHVYRITLNNQEDLKATIVWNDPTYLPASEPQINSKYKWLQNDLDLRVVRPNGSPVMPYTLDPENPSYLAQPGDNSIDNVEQVFIPDAPPGVYEIKVSFKGTLHNQQLATGEQRFALVVTGHDDIEHFSGCGSNQNQLGICSNPQYTETYDCGKDEGGPNGDGWFFSVIENDYILYAPNEEASFGVSFEGSPSALDVWSNNVPVVFISQWVDIGDLFVHAGNDITTDPHTYINTEIRGGSTRLEANSSIDWQGGANNSPPDEIRGDAYVHFLANDVYVSDVTLSGQAEMIIQANESITLGPGFAAELGVSLTASTIDASQNVTAPPSAPADLVVQEGAGDHDSADASSEETPDSFELLPSYPNPFNPSTVVPFSLPVPADVRIEVYDVLGRRVAILADGFHETGRYELSFDASHLASGLYLVRARFTNNRELRTFTQKLLLAK